jgi:uncharacterized protein YjbJ (UPF0337 family)
VASDATTADARTGKQRFEVRSRRAQRVDESDEQRRHVMGNLDQAKGRAKQAMGDLTDDDDMRREGKIDEKAGDVKDKVGDAVDKVKEKITDR